MNDQELYAEIKEYAEASFREGFATAAAMYLELMLFDGRLPESFAAAQDQAVAEWRAKHFDDALARAARGEE